MTRLMSGVFALVALVAGGYAIMGLQGANTALPQNPLIGAASAQEAAEIDTSTVPCRSSPNRPSTGSSPDRSTSAYQASTVGAQA